MRTLNPPTRSPLASKVGRKIREKLIPLFLKTGADKPAKTSLPGDTGGSSPSAAGSTAQGGKIIRVLCSEIPKGAANKARFACYRDGETVADFEARVRARFGDLEAEQCAKDIAHDVSRRFIRISNPD